MSRCLAAALLAVPVVAAGCAHGHAGPSLSVTPASALVDAPFRVRITGLSPHEAVTIALSERSREGKPWRATFSARADGRGEVDLRDRYLIDLLRPVRPPDPIDYLPEDQHVTITARARSFTATVRARRFLTLPSVSITHERPEKVGFYGEWVVPRGARRHPAILLLGGSEGGVRCCSHALLLAAHGYPTLALAYFGEPGLPRTLARIPLEYFQRVLEWMHNRREVDPEHVFTFGISRGGELSLVLASTYPSLVHGAVGYVPSSLAVSGIPDIRQPAWTYRGKPVLGDIPVERIVGPVFVAGGGDDMLWPSGLSVQIIKLELRHHDRRDVALVYPHAGHGLGVGIPNEPELSTVVSASRYGTLDLGGSPQADQAAREDSWPRLLRFLAQAS